MGLLDIVRSGVAIANKLTADLQPSVRHYPFFYEDGDGTRHYDPPAGVLRPALVIRKQRLVKTGTGELVLSQATVTFLDPGVVVNELDKIELPDGTTGPILNTEGFVDRGTGHPILTEIYLG